jgi:superfamily II DNA or RNA helicase
MRFEKHTVPHNEEIITGYDREKYDKVAKERWNPFDDEPVVDIAEACRLMRRIVNSDGERLEAVESLMKKHPKLIIFYNFNYELEMLRTLSNVIDIAEWNGQLHQPIPDSDRWLYLVQYSAGAEGWNCTQTDAMIFFSQSYSYKQMTQAAGRIDRLNTPFKDLYYYTLRSHASIDVAIGKALKGKRTFNEKNFAKQAGIDLPLSAK